MSRLGRPKKDGKQVNIVQAFKGKSHIAQPSSFEIDDEITIEEVELDQDGNQSIPSISLPKKPKISTSKRTWKNEWRLRHKWAYPITNDSGELRIKCEYCAKFNKDTPFAKDGSSTIQLTALHSHANSEPHKHSEQQWETLKNPSTVPITKHVETMMDSQKNRIISVMEIMYFVAVNNLSLECYKSMCDLHRYKCTPNMPLTNEYSSYTNVSSGKEFLRAAKIVYWNKLKEEIHDSPFYSIMVDESTDNHIELHLIVYIIYILDKGKGPATTKFIRLLKLKDGTSQSMYDAISNLLTEMKLPKSKMVGFGSDGAASMRGIREGLSAKLSREIPHLIAVHCVAHREALAATEATNHFPEFTFVERLANKTYSWLGKSAKRHTELKGLMAAFEIGRLEVLQIHHVRWLSRGQVMERMVKIMPALLKEWQLEDPNLYSKATIFQVQFCIHLLADVLVELNILNKKFQEDNMDITFIGTHIDVVIDILRRRFLRNTFGVGAQHTSSFLSRSSEGTVEFVDDTGVVHIHILKVESLPNSLGSGSLEDCIALGRAFVERIINNLNERFMDLPIFNAAKLFSPKDYYEEEYDREIQIKRWMTCLCEKFHSQGLSNIANIEKCGAEVERFSVTLFKAYPKKNMIKAWEQCGAQLEWIEAYPNLMQLWQALLVIPASTAACERGFSQMNRIKDDERSKLSLDTLDTLMFLTLSAPHALDKVEWDLVYDTWKEMKLRRALSLE